MFLNDGRLIEIPYNDISLEEAIYMMEHHDGERYCDCDKKMLVMVE